MCSLPSFRLAQVQLARQGGPAWVLVRVEQVRAVAASAEGALAMTVGPEGALADAMMSSNSAASATSSGSPADEVYRHRGGNRQVERNFEGSRFTGRFSGVGFGQRVGVDRWWEHGGIENRDFSEARLDECSFQHCDMRTIRLPKWPCFTIVDPIKHGPELVRVPWPGDFTPVFLEGEHRDPEDTAAVTIYAPEEAKRSGATLEEFKAAVERFDFIVR